MKTEHDPRHQARMLVLQKLFAKDFMALDREEITIEQLKEINEFDNYDVKLFEDLFEGVISKTGEIDDYIRKYAPAWPIEQIKKVDLEILRIAIFEGFISEITPPKVAIDEAIELAKSFGGNTSDKFVNGVLGAILEKRNK